MKKIVLSLAFMLTGTLSFANSTDLNKVSEKSEKLNLVKTLSVKADGLIVKSCTYDVISTTTFQVIVQITVTDVPDMLPCNDKKLTAAVNEFINS
jgi:AICAR transformylase/IMP cyclohydrolase PurH